MTGREATGQRPVPLPPKPSKLLSGSAATTGRETTCAGCGNDLPECGPRVEGSERCAPCISTGCTGSSGRVESCSHPEDVKSMDGKTCLTCEEASGREASTSTGGDMSGSRQPDAVALAEEEYDLAAYWEAMTSSDLEGAYMSRDEERKRLLTHRLGVTSRVRHRAYDRWVAARRAAAPAFEALLADPTQQFDKDGEVLASILAYQDAVPATACGCLGAMHKACKP